MKFSIFGVFKRAILYGFKTQFKNLNEYISYYNKQKIKAKLKGLSPTK
ncbi:IS3 family transposase [Lactobacillus panisapium]|uniref:IS3 family transposase n=1 Tax=Lactobacillus panisapium TaxID=2012495 RepID=A0ABX8W3Y0_9LACO|nr:IS3 family transposase [Lactobacillus panisapium]